MESYNTCEKEQDRSTSLTVESNIDMNCVGTTMEILHYNQNLVQLADSKAGNFIVINSIFMASITSFMMNTKWNLAEIEGILQICFFIASVSAIFLCLNLIMTKGDFSEKVQFADLVFFKDIIRRQNSNMYIYEFSKAKPKHIFKDILRRIYATSLIADRKFSLCILAQNCTFVSSILWLISIITILFK